MMLEKIHLSNNVLLNRFTYALIPGYKDVWTGTPSGPIATPGNACSTGIAAGGGIPTIVQLYICIVNHKWNM